MSMQSAVRGYVVALMVFIPLVVHAAPGDSLSPSIRSVWDLSAQPCNGGGGNAMHRSPYQAAIQESHIVELPSLRIKFRVPRLPDLPDMTIKLYLGDRSRGVTDNYILLAEHDLSPPMGAVVVTELPADFDTEKALSAVNVLEQQLMTGSGAAPAFERIRGPYGEAIELMVPNRVGTHCFPTSKFQLAPADASERTIGISRFVFTGGRLVEFALIVRVSPTMAAEEQTALARKLMDLYWLGLSLT